MYVGNDSSPFKMQNPHKSFPPIFYFLHLFFLVIFIYYFFYFFLLPLIFVLFFPQNLEFFPKVEKTIPQCLSRIIENLRPWIMSVLRPHFFCTCVTSKSTCMISLHIIIHDKVLLQLTVHLPLNFKVEYFTLIIIKSVFNWVLKHENFTLMSHFVTQPAEITHKQTLFDSFDAAKSCGFFFFFFFLTAPLMYIAMLHG